MTKKKTENIIWYPAQKVEEEWVYDENLDCMVLRERKVKVYDKNEIPFKSESKIVRGK